MPALNYKAQFERLLVSGHKRQTIRALRKDGRNPKPGETLYHYTGMRTASCRKIMTTGCKSVHPVKIFEAAGEIVVTIDGKLLSGVQVRILALADGFKNAAEFLRFFRENHGLPFDGLLIKW